MANCVRVVTSGSAVAVRRLRQLVEVAAHRARDRRRSIVVSFSTPIPRLDPLQFFDASWDGQDARFFWAHPAQGYALAAVGAAWTFEPHGAAPFADAKRAWHERIADAIVEAPTNVPCAGPLLVGGFAFDANSPADVPWADFPRGKLVLPRTVVAQSSGSTWLTVNGVITPDADVHREVSSLAVPFDGWTDLGSDVRWQSDRCGKSEPLRDRQDVPSGDRWRDVVRLAVDELRSGRFGKVVLARACRVVGDRAFDPVPTVMRLRNTYPECFVFAVAHGDRCFLGASPERLVRLRDGEVRATALAGSIRRGVDGIEDEHLAAALSDSAKEQVEHAVVVAALRRALDGVCTELTVADQPTLLKIRNVQHLMTPVVGRVGEGYSILDLVERLHPTPAVGGDPTDAALQFIRQHERLDRGWYAGPVGWLDGRGDGEFAVAIRSALLHGNEAWLFAGCGIVADSDPESEYAESQLKLMPLLSALQGSMAT